MAGFYDRMAAKTLEMLQKYGTDMTLTQSTGSPIFDPATGTVDPDETSSVTIKGIIQSPNLSRTKEQVGDFLFDKNEVLSGDRFILVAALGMASKPKPGDTITVNSDVYNVIAMIPVSPAGLDLAYRILARR